MQKMIWYSAKESEKYVALELDKYMRKSMKINLKDWGSDLFHDSVNHAKLVLESFAPEVKSKNDRPGLLAVSF